MVLLGCVNFIIMLFWMLAEVVCAIAQRGDGMPPCTGRAHRPTTCREEVLCNYSVYAVKCAPMVVSSREGVPCNVLHSLWSSHCRTPIKPRCIRMRSGQVSLAVDEMQAT